VHKGKVADGAGKTRRVPIFIAQKQRFGAGVFVAFGAGTINVTVATGAEGFFVHTSHHLFVVGVDVVQQMTAAPRATQTITVVDTSQQRDAHLTLGHVSLQHNGLVTMAAKVGAVNGQ